MEALTALSLAGTIVQFVDFSVKILTSSREIYTSTTGSLTCNNEINLVTEDLLAIIAKLRHDESLSENFEHICREATKVAQDLVKRLDGLKLKGKAGVWNTFGQAVKSAFTKSEINELVDRLSKLSKAVEIHVLVSLRFASFLTLLMDIHSS
jgi:hypothetical protein